MTPGDRHHQPAIEGGQVDTGSDQLPQGWGCLALLILATMTAVLLFWRLGDRPLLDWEEARYAQVAREMLASGHWLDLSWNGAPYFNKPPFLFWATALSFHTFGESEWAARLPCALFGVGSVLLVCVLARRLYTQIVGFGAALLLLSLYPFLTHGSRQIAPDAPLLFWSLLALFAFWQGRQQSSWFVIIGIATGLGLLTKGIAAVIPLVAIITFILYNVRCPISVPAVSASAVQ